MCAATIPTPCPYPCELRYLPLEGALQLVRLDAERGSPVHEERGAAVEELIAIGYIEKVGVSKGIYSKSRDSKQRGLAETLLVIDRRGPQ
jgi:hypothetical protein